MSNKGILQTGSVYLVTKAKSKRYDGLYLQKINSEVTDKEKIDVAERVYKALEEDGFHGPYTLGEDLWNEFESKFKGDKQ